ncbi:hypothetical protein [Kutzneria buriramensis]|uniref:Uncharacterized protein n=1 Tax=Kutzneria buriramensis TaxID=1045776 RepID=A0A3E0HGQ8_9PSEU|nr:hypothetical protein [Kutzneria buriramensis]REH44972.1 hypothetical protein BCF44_108453 [Kutzneria buriramensis]
MSNESKQSGRGCGIVLGVVVVCLVWAAGAGLIWWGTSIQEACAPNCITSYRPREGDDQTLVNLLWLGGGALVILGIVIGVFFIREFVFDSNAKK